MPLPPEQHVIDAVEEHRQLRTMYAATFGTEEGMKVLNHLQAVNHVLQPSHISSDPYHTAFRDGERSAVLGIISMIAPFDEAAEIKRVEDQLPSDPLADFSRQGKE